MDDEELLSSLTKWHTIEDEHRTQSIGEVFDAYIRKGLKRHKRQSRVVDLWKEKLPGELAKHCRQVSLLRGVLKVEVEAGVYMFEMQGVRQTLLEQLQRDCPGAGIDSIKLVSCETLKKPDED